MFILLGKRATGHYFVYRFVRISRDHVFGRATHLIVNDVSLVFHYFDTRARGGIDHFAGSLEQSAVIDPDLGYDKGRVTGAD